MNFHDVALDEFSSRLNNQSMVLFASSVAVPRHIVSQSCTVTLLYNLWSLPHALWQSHKTHHDSRRESTVAVTEFIVIVTDFIATVTEFIVTVTDPLWSTQNLSWQSQGIHYDCHRIHCGCHRIHCDTSLRGWLLAIGDAGMAGDV